MTIKRKIITLGAITFFIFVALAYMNIWTHQQVLSNLDTRDTVNEKLAVIEKFAKWKNELIRSISDIVASGHVPPFTIEQFNLPFETPIKEGELLVSSGKTLVFLISEKERASRDVERIFRESRMKINGLYYQLDEKIATVLAVAQMDQVLGVDSSEKSSLAPYVLKSLNQLTLVALNSIISRKYSEIEKGVTARNKRFVLSQIQTIDEDGSVFALFKELFVEIESLEAVILESNRILENFNIQIAKAKDRFDQALGGTEIEARVAAAQLEVKKANLILEKASKRTLITMIILLFVAPVLIITVGIFGLNTLIIGPITHLVEAMKNVENGSFDVTAPVKTQDEIGQLARAFNAMAGEIKAKVTELSQLNQTLRESEAKYRILVDNLPQRIFLKNRDLAYVSCNLNFARDIGIIEEEIVGRSDFDFFPRTLAEKYRNDDQRIIRSETTEEIEETYVKDGEELIVQTVKTPIWNEEGSVSGVLGIFWDITERKRAEEELQLARFSLENTSIAVFRTDSHGLIQYVNEIGCALLGYSRDELLTMRLWDVEPGLTPDIFAQVWHSMSDGEPRHFQSTHRRKDGSTFPVEISVRQGEFQGVRFNFAFVNDVTDRKKLEAKLFQAQKMEAVGTLAGGIAHDFNNLLQAISGYTQMLLLDKNEQSPDRESLTAIERAVNRAANLVRQLLLFSRKTETERKPVLLNSIIDQACRILERTIPRMIDIEVHSDRRLWTVKADPVQMEQILLNFGKNAADAMPEGGTLVFGTENVTLEDKDSQRLIGASLGNYVLLSVSDTGLGMDKETVEHIFEPFFTTKEIGKGTGLGLASVYGIVKSHGGHITCYSEVGKGTTFRIYLPALQEDIDDEVPGAGAGKPSPRGSETILLVDDEEPIRDFGSNLLSRFGYTVLIASSGEEALDIYSDESTEIDLVILDIGMPGMGGFKCLEEIIQHDPSAKVLIASGYSINGHGRRAKESGAAGYVGKPYQMNDLLDKIRSVLDREKE